MTRRTPQEIAEKQIQRVSASLPYIQQGVQAVSEAPGKRAAAAQEKMLRGITEAITSGKWAANVSAVSVERWRELMLEKGVPRIAQGIAAARPKLEAFHSQLQSFQAPLLSQIKSMPNLTLQDGINRATYMMTEMSKFRFRKGGL